jgi:hypothetical protein
MNNLKQSIIKIPLSKNAPVWNSSTPPPHIQLADLGRRGPFVDGFRDYNYDPSLADLVKGKRIAYVCPSPHLKGLEMGKLIDSYDLVVRVNQAYHQPASDWRDYGERTDILMNCLNINKLNALNKNPEFVETLKFIVCPMVSMWDVQRCNDFLKASGVPWHNVCDGYLFKIFKEAGTTCNTGLTGLITLLNYDVKEIYLTGMTFFNMNSFGNIYSETYHDEAAKNNNFRNTMNRHPSVVDLRIDIHQQQPQIDYFKKILNHHYPDRLKIDDYLIKNFKKA